MEQIEFWPRTIQANLYRFYERIIKPAMLSAPVHKGLVIGEASSVDEFLQRAADQVDNYTANEANKIYSLMLVALFERYLRLWAGQLFIGTNTDTRQGNLMALVDKVAERADIDLQTQDLRATLQEALLVGNVVRHGEGGALNKIKKLASHLIDRSMQDYIDLVAQKTPDSEWLRIRPQDIQRYVRGMIRFGGLADKQPNSITCYSDV